MNNELIRIRVSGVVNSEKSIGALVDLFLNEQDNVSSAGRLVWFPLSISSLEEIPQKDNILKQYYVTAPKWFLEKNKITF